ncbi:MAG: carbon starvation protein A [Kiritimatiellaeota bacterium]|nr:carbon starvation protein A [Kiritimatiellota bacterium]
MLTIIFIGVLLVFLAAYFIYGRFLDRRFDVDDKRPTPSHTDYDGIDWIPTHPVVLFGHHFSAIAGAGPIVGPIIASLAFGWGPPLLWILIGAIFVGGVQDFSALIASIRRGGRSIAQIARETMSPLAFHLLLLFIWLSLVYVLTVFTDLTAVTFVEDGGIATASVLFIALAIGFGMCVYRLKMSVWMASLIFVPLVFLGVWVGQEFPILPAWINNTLGCDPKKAWCLLLIVYCFVASTVPVWILLQPRDYLSSYLLYSSILGAFLGILLGGFPIQYPAFKGWQNPQLGMLFPILFITIACGACSGFHSLVSSGTTAKQLNKETDARKIGYGAMLVEGMVAVIGLIVVAMLPKTGALTSQDPMIIYGNGMAKFLGVFGVPAKIGFSFGLLALSTFILTTLDAATRLGRYIFEEFLGLKGHYVRYLSTILTLALPTLFVLIPFKDAAGNPISAWKAIWPVFGATNQMLAGLALLVILVWLKKIGKPIGFILWPMIFMLGMTVWALVMLIGQYRLSLIGIIAMLLFALALLLIVEAARALKTKPAAEL